MYLGISGVCARGAVVAVVWMQAARIFPIYLHDLLACSCLSFLRSVPMNALQSQVSDGVASAASSLQDETMSADVETGGDAETVKSFDIDELPLEACAVIQRTHEDT